jgi:hypothetical protein
VNILSLQEMLLEDCILQRLQQLRSDVTVATKTNDGLRSLVSLEKEASRNLRAVGLF